jgi:hypothetical protein
MTMSVDVENFDVLIGGEQGLVSVFANQAGRAALRFRQGDLVVDWRDTDDLPEEWQCMVFDTRDDSAPMSGRDFALRITKHLGQTKLRVGWAMVGGTIEVIKG